MITIYGKASTKKEITEMKSESSRIYKLVGENNKVVYLLSFGEIAHLKSSGTLKKYEYVYFRNKVFQIADTDCKELKSGCFAYAI